MQQARIYCAWLPSEIFLKYVQVRKGEKERQIIACVASVSSRVRPESWDESKKKERTGEGEGNEGTACPQTPRF